MSGIICIGLMSGTSVDGVDVAITTISGEPPHVSVQLDYFETVPFSAEVRTRIFRLFEQSVTAAEVSQMNVLLGHVFADAVLQVVNNAGVDITNVMFISSHGQTVYHHPIAEEIAGYAVTSTLQIGEAAVIVEKTGRPVVADFRVRDMAAGGQGAPLVPFVDALLFAHPERGRILANVGGIANLTVLPRGAAAEQTLAFDTGPGNMIIDGLVTRFTDGRLRYDEDGRMASAGQVLEDYLATWLRMPFFQAQPPKSTGRELFGEQMVEQWWRDAQEQGFAPEDVIATATAFTVRSFARAIQAFVLPHHAIDEMIVGGGGSYNPVMLDGLRRELPALTVLTQDQATGIPSSAKEAVAFAVLGYETYYRRPSNLPAATGAKRPVVLGKITWD
ncbi:anhydro-N-acetylmuramic acid kinase [Tumebacillus permanentifrigoris]|uniref:Anhydro-N-acetylmuramic acid kinase n=1 Tax=Tumebacillus permanentifrigoris TaxID=378543 RepID=A0A316DD50_9BACL|nr:anhydro-N-acetylmuramic acid kinase [Tumebacillus permanentifrigoris]PWK15628.1 anhydro-N-acetylmuramic acid kinase [Tumebacillus permanentifrigoris]